MLDHSVARSLRRALARRSFDETQQYAHACMASWCLWLQQNLPTGRVPTVPTQWMKPQVKSRLVTAKATSNPWTSASQPANTTWCVTACDNMSVPTCDIDGVRARMPCPPMRVSVAVVGTHTTICDWLFDLSHATPAHMIVACVLLCACNGRVPSCFKTTWFSVSTRTVCQ